MVEKSKDFGGGSSLRCWGAGRTYFVTRVTIKVLYLDPGNTSLEGLASSTAEDIIRCESCMRVFAITKEEQRRR